MTTTTPCTGCAVQQGTHQPAEALHKIAEPDAQHLQELAAYRFTVENLRARVAELEAQLAESTHPTQQGMEQPIKWPKARDVGRFGDMSPDGSIRVGLDADNDVYVSICDGTSVADIEFCTPGGGGGRSSRTRMALIALMCAIEADNASHPAFDFWQRNLAAQAKQGGAA